MSRSETRENTPESKDLEKILTIWQKREQRYKDSSSLYLDFCSNDAGEIGKKNLEAIFSKCGRESALKLLGLVDGLNLEIQARLLSLGREDAPILIKAIEASRRQPTAWESIKKHIWPKTSPPSKSSQKELYRGVVREMLTVKFPDQETPRLMEKLPSVSDLWYDEFFGTAGVALQKGPDFLLEVFNFIPPEEFMPDKFDKRLEFEKRAREKGQRPVKRKYKFTGTVHGVGFRDFCRQKTSSDLWGKMLSAKNEEDGSVTVVVRGLPTALDNCMTGFCQAAVNELGIPLPMMSLEKEDPVMSR